MKTQEQHDRDGGPAYPSTIHIEDNNGTHYEDHPGMTLRDWFAGQALCGMQQNYEQIARYLEQAGGAYRATEVRQFMAFAAYAQADAILKERNENI